MYIKVLSQPIFFLNNISVEDLFSQLSSLYLKKKAKYRWLTLFHEHAIVSVYQILNVTPSTPITAETSSARWAQSNSNLERNTNCTPWCRGRDTIMDLTSTMRQGQAGNSDRKSKLSRVLNRKHVICPKN